RATRHIHVARPGAALRALGHPWHSPFGSPAALGSAVLTIWSQRFFRMCEVEGQSVTAESQPRIEYARRRDASSADQPCAPVMGHGEDSYRHFGVALRAVARANAARIQVRGQGTALHHPCTATARCARTWVMKRGALTANLNPRG